MFPKQAETNYHEIYDGFAFNFFSTFREKTNPSHDECSKTNPNHINPIKQTE